MFDFLIDIVPREEFKAAKEAKEAASGHGKSASGGVIEHRRSQESFPIMGGAGPGGPTAAGGGGGPIGLEGYGYPYGMLENGQFSMVSFRRAWPFMFAIRCVFECERGMKWMDMWAVE